MFFLLVSRYKAMMRTPVRKATVVAIIVRPFVAMVREAHDQSVMGCQKAAMAFADEETETSLKELRSSMVELREGIEAETFPLTTLEILIDKIEDLIGQ